VEYRWVRSGRRLDGKEHDEVIDGVKFADGVSRAAAGRGRP
jgi:hypothetical protein